MSDHPNAVPTPGIAAGVIRCLAPLLLVAAALPAIGVDPVAGGWRELRGLLAATSTVAALQLFALWWLGRRADRRLGRALVAASREPFDLASRLVTGFVIAAAAIGALIGPLALLASAVVAGRDPGALLTAHLVTYLPVQALLLLPLRQIANTHVRAPLGGLAGPDEEPRAGRRPLGITMFWVILLPAAGVALILGFEAERLLERHMLASATECYGRLNQAVLAAEPLPAGAEATGLFESLTRFDLASPFVVDRRAGVARGIDERELALVRRAERDARAWVIDPPTGTGLAVAAAGDAATMVGVRVAPGQDPRSPYIIASLLLAAAFGCALLALAIGARVREALAWRVAALDAIPDGERIDLPPQGIREIDLLDEALELARDRSANMHVDAAEAIEERKAAREKKARVFTGMSHDLRSPLNSVIGFTDLLLKGMDGDLSADQRATIARIAQQSERLLVTIGDILDTAKLDAGRFELERAWVPSVEILTECVAGTHRLVASKDIEFVEELQPGLPPVQVDKERVLQALLSLIARAIDTMETGKLTLRASRETRADGGRILRVDVIDSGQAIPSVERKRLANVFRATTASGGSGRDGGMGLGLSLARRIVGLHDGQITVRTRSGGGSVFSLTLPLDDPDSTA